MSGDVRLFKGGMTFDDLRCPHCGDGALDVDDYGMELDDEAVFVNARWTCGRCGTRGDMLLRAEYVGAFVNSDDDEYYDAGVERSPSKKRTATGRTPARKTSTKKAPARRKTAGTRRRCSRLRGSTTRGCPAPGA